MFLKIITIVEKGETDFVGHHFKYRFYCPNKLIKWRLKTYFTKEPETLKWIESFHYRSKFFDVGANIGLYSIYASKRGNSVYAFEPEAMNYSILVRNFNLNSVMGSAYCLALSDKSQFGYLKTEFTEGGANNQFEDYIRITGTVSFTLDEITARLGVPDHIKIDVDGLESKIVSGGLDTLSKIKSLLIEVDESMSGNTDMLINIQRCGLKLQSKNQSEMFKNSKYSTIYNYIFKR